MSASVAETATLAHGFTMADVDRAARMAASKARTGDFLSWQERHDIAWMAIVERVYDGSEMPSLVKVGLQAISKESNDHLRHHGLRYEGRKQDEFAPAFSIYWRHIGAGGDRDFTDTIAERIALSQVLAQLTDAEYEAVAALAAFGSSTEAAEAIGITLAAFTSRMTTARRRMEALWFAPETPPDKRQQQLSMDGECNNGHDMKEHGVVYSGRIQCRRCKRNSQRRARARA